MGEPEVILADPISLGVTFVLVESQAVQLAGIFGLATVTVTESVTVAPAEFVHVIEYVLEFWVPAFTVSALLPDVAPLLI
jgi:hypothetical protein